jgi:hypothetical protein
MGGHRLTESFEVDEIVNRLTKGSEKARENAEEKIKYFLNNLQEDNDEEKKSRILTPSPK